MVTIKAEIQPRTGWERGRAGLANMPIGVSPGREDLVSQDKRAQHGVTWLKDYVGWRGLGPTRSDRCIPVEDSDEDQRQWALDNLAWLLFALAFVLGAVAVFAPGPSPHIWLWAIVSCVLGLAALLLHHVWLRLWLLSHRLILPIYTQPPAPGSHIVHLRERVRISLAPHLDEDRIRVSESLATDDAATAGAKGSLVVTVRQLDAAADVDRANLYARRFGAVRPSDLSLGYVAFDAKPRVDWASAGDEATSGKGLRVTASSRVLRIGAPAAFKEVNQILGPKQQQWQFEKDFELQHPLDRCPSISISVMTEGFSASRTLRLCLSRAVEDRSPETKIRLVRLSGDFRLAAQPSFRPPVVETYRIPSDRAIDRRPIQRVAIRPEPSIHPPKFNFTLVDEPLLGPGESVTAFVVFDGELVFAAEDSVTVIAAFRALSPVAGIRQVALFDALGYSAQASPKRAKGSSRPSILPAQFENLAFHSELEFAGEVPLERLRIVKEETLGREQPIVRAGRLPDANLVHDLIWLFATAYRLIIRDVREDLAERSAADRGALVWTILAKASESMMSPDVILRVAPMQTSATAGEGNKDAVSLELSVIVRYFTPEQLASARDLHGNLHNACVLKVEEFVSEASRRDGEPMEFTDATDRDVGSVGLESSLTDDVAVRFANLVDRAEILIERFERIFRNS